MMERADRVAEIERARLGVSMKEQLGWKNDRAAFLSWRELIESQGVFTYQFTLGPDNTRGFCLLDDKQLPIIVIDRSEDTYGAKIFTLWHEYAHILLRLGGISGQDPRNSVESYCNLFAAAFLMPADVFKIEADRIKGVSSSDWDDRQLAELAARFKVSKSAVALRLEAVELAGAGLYGRMMGLWKTRSTRRRSPGRATYAQRTANRLGGLFVNTVFAALDRGKISRLDAYEFINVGPTHFAELRAEVKERQTAFGRGFRA
jgi:Zn-dependent peptidase ImmA (M78 family)